MPEPLVLLPGMNCSERLWMPVEERLRRERPSTQIVHGALQDGTLDDCVDRLLASLPDRFALAGLSLGGIVAMALVRRAPGRVTRLCVASTNARGPRAEQREAWAAQRRELAEGRTARDLQRDLLPLLVEPGSRTAELDEIVLAMADDVGEDRLDQQLSMQATRIDERPGLAEVTASTLVLAAEKDALCPVERHEEIAARIPGARLAVLPGRGHLAPLEDPAGVAAELAAWLRA